MATLLAMAVPDRVLGALVESAAAVRALINNPKAVETRGHEEDISWRNRVCSFIID
jgi:hypothetical protein